MRRIRAHRPRALDAYAHARAWRGRRARLALVLTLVAIGLGAFAASGGRPEEPRPLEASGAPSGEPVAPPDADARPREGPSSPLDGAPSRAADASRDTPRALTDARNLSAPPPRRA